MRGASISSTAQLLHSEVVAAEQIEHCEEFAKLYVGPLQFLSSILGKSNENFVCDVGIRLAAWLQLCRGHGSVPHRISLFVHPEHTELAEPLVRFGISRLLETSVHRIYCLVREYDLFVITALRNSRIRAGLHQSPAGATRSFTGDEA